MEDKSKIAELALGVTLSLMAAVTLSAGEVQDYADTIRIDTIGLTDHIRGMLQAISILTKSDSLPAFYLFLDTQYNPAPRVRCVLGTGNTKQVKYSDANGEVLFWVPRSKRSKVEFNAYYDRPVKHYSSMAGCFPAGDSGESLNPGFFGSITLSLRLLRATRNAPLKISYGMPEMGGKGIRVLYFQKYESQARRLLDDEKLCKDVIDSILKIKLMPLKVVIEGERAPAGLHFDGAWWTDKESSPGFAFGLLPHEWIESSLGEIYLAVTDDYTTRWIGDGLAQYVRFYIEELYNPSGLAYQYNSVWSKVDTSKVYDLKSWQGGSPANFGGGSVGMSGYELSPYFWAKIVEKSGNPLLIPLFLEELRVSKNKSSDTAIAILSRLSGLDVEKELVIPGTEFRANVGRYWPEPDTANPRSP